LIRVAKRHKGRAIFEVPNDGAVEERGASSGAYNGVLGGCHVVMSLDVAFKILKPSGGLFVHLFEAMNLDTVRCTPQPREVVAPTLLLSNVFSINKKRPRNPQELTPHCP
jgi:hypothetical protein